MKKQKRLSTYHVSDDLSIGMRDGLREAYARWIRWAHYGAGTRPGELRRWMYHHGIFRGRRSATDAMVDVTIDLARQGGLVRRCRAAIVALRGYPDEWCERLEKWGRNSGMMIAADGEMIPCNVKVPVRGPDAWRMACDAYDAFPRDLARAILDEHSIDDYGIEPDTRGSYRVTSPHEIKLTTNNAPRKRGITPAVIAELGEFLRFEVTPASEPRMYWCDRPYGDMPPTGEREMREMIAMGITRGDYAP